MITKIPVTTDDNKRPKVGDEFTLAYNLAHKETVHHYYEQTFKVSQDDIDTMVSEGLTFEEYCKEYVCDFIDDTEYSEEVEDLRIKKH